MLALHLPRSHQNHQHEETSLHSQAWSLILQHLLEELIKLTGSNFVILRKLEADGNLVLERFAPQSHPQQIRPIQHGEFEIPHRKEPDCWGNSDPTHTWGVVSYPSPDDHVENLEHSTGERKFILWVGEKAWFPIELANGTVGLVILVRGRRSRAYEVGDVARAWVVAQGYISGELDDRYHAGFVQALDALSLARCAKQPSQFVRAVTHSLASQYGLGWNRVWLLEEKCSGKGQFSCKYCLGGVQKDQWLKAVAGLQSKGFSNLEEEVRASMSRESNEDDRLLDACGEDRMEFHLEKEEYSRLFDQVEETVNERSFGFARPLTGELDGAGRRFRAEVEAAVATVYPNEKFSPAATTYAFGIKSETSRILVAFSQPYSQSREQPSLVLTTAYLQHTARVMSEWKANLSALEEEEI